MSNIKQAVLIPIYPRFCKLIGEGRKTYEIRKNIPKLTLPFKCYIYETRTHNGCGKVIGEFVCDETKKFSIDPVFDNITLCGICAASCLSCSQLQDYAFDYCLYGWHISKLKIYNKPRPLSDFQQCHKCKNTCIPNTRKNCSYHRLTKAPQSWCYVNEI